MVQRVFPPSIDCRPVPVIFFANFMRSRQKNCGVEITTEPSGFKWNFPVRKTNSSCPPENRAEARTTPWIFFKVSFSLDEINKIIEIRWGSPDVNTSATAVSLEAWVKFLKIGGSTTAIIEVKVHQEFANIDIPSIFAKKTDRVIFANHIISYGVISQNFEPLFKNQLP